jgi:WW domain-containing oxidoreductase
LLDCCIFAGRLEKCLSNYQKGVNALQVSFMKLDLASLADCKAFSERVAALPELDVVVCNAGLMCPIEHTLTADGMEVQFQACF